MGGNALGNQSIKAVWLRPVEGAVRNESAEADMAGKKKVQQAVGKHRKSAGQTEGQYEKDRKGRQGQYGAAGSAPLTKK